MSKLICIDSGANGGICVWDLKTHTFVLEKLTGDTMETLKPVLDRHFAVTADIEEVVIERPPRFMGTMIPSSRIAVLFEAFGITLGYLAAKNLTPIEVTPVEWQRHIRDEKGIKRGEIKHAEWKKQLTLYAREHYGERKDLTGQTADALLLADWYFNVQNPLLRKPQA
jgi:hypothetical protein